MTLTARPPISRLRAGWGCEVALWGGVWSFGDKSGALFFIIAVLLKRFFFFFTFNFSFIISSSR